MKILPINLEDLLHARSVESVRREFKKTWSEHILESVVHSICAFANDFFNLNGGYIILGIEEKNGQPVLPHTGWTTGIRTISRNRSGVTANGSIRNTNPCYHLKYTKTNRFL